MRDRGTASESARPRRASHRLRRTAVTAAVLTSLSVPLATTPASASAPQLAHRTTATGSVLARPLGVGPLTWARVPSSAHEVLVVQGAGWSSSHNVVTLWQWNGAGWVDEASWSGHNGEFGWTTVHHVGDLHSPTGVYTLHNAGGRLRNPGTRLTYDYSPASYALGGSSASGTSRRHLFDYVVAIDYNRVIGTAPRDPRRPRGYGHGGGIWLHVTNGNYTNGCVAVPESAMTTVERRLNPADHPVIIMGPTSYDAR